MRSFFSRLPPRIASSGKEPDHLKGAKMLVGGASVFIMTGSYNEIGGLFPHLKTLCPPDRVQSRWDFFMTVAAVGTAMLALPYHPDSPLHEEISKQVFEDLGSWDEQAPQALIDFAKFTRRSLENGMEPSETVGSWVVLNLKESNPTEEDYGIVRTLGDFLFKAFAGWWSNS